MCSQLLNFNICSLRFTNLGVQILVLEFRIEILGLKLHVQRFRAQGLRVGLRDLGCRVL